jgi:hypothetical protein
LGYTSVFYFSCLRTCGSRNIGARHSKVSGVGVCNVVCPVCRVELEIVQELASVPKQFWMECRFCANLNSFRRDEIHEPAAQGRLGAASISAVHVSSA